MFRQGKKEKEKRVSFLCSTGRGGGGGPCKKTSRIPFPIGKPQRHRLWSGATIGGPITWWHFTIDCRAITCLLIKGHGWQIGSLRIGSYASVPRQGAWLECGAAVLSRATETRRGQWEKGIEKLAFRPSRRQIKRYSANLEVSSLSLSLFLSLFVSVCLFDSLLFV